MVVLSVLEKSAITKKLMFSGRELFVYIRARDLHKSLGIFQLVESVLLVQTVGIFGGENKSSEEFQLFERKDECHQRFGQSFSAISFINKNIGQVSEGCQVSDQPCKTYLFF